MTTRLANALQRHRHLKDARVLCQKNGQPLRANMLAYLVERATRKAGLPTGHKPRHAGPHLLRHTFCSHLSMRGAPARATQKLAGHRDLGTTQQYMHLSPLAIEAAIRLLELLPSAFAPTGLRRDRSRAARYGATGPALRATPRQGPAPARLRRDRSRACAATAQQSLPCY
jgi:hypothetical protein